jgi:hypothetical protein
VGAIIYRDPRTGQTVPQIGSGTGGGVTDHGDLTGLADDDHPQYALTDGTRGNFEAAGAVAAHAAAADPHLGYQKESEKGSANGYASLGTDGKVPAAQLPAAAAPGVTDHGGLTGLADDDHPQYLNNARGDARYATKQYTDAADALKANIASPTFSNDITISGAAPAVVMSAGVTIYGYQNALHITDPTWSLYRTVVIRDPISPQEGATKNYVDGRTSGKRTYAGSAVATTDGFGDININFGTSFAAAPVVVACLGDFLNGLGGCFVLAASITTTTCKVRVIGSQNNGQPVTGTNVRVNWTAIGN